MVWSQTGGDARHFDEGTFRRFSSFEAKFGEHRRSYRNGPLFQRPEILGKSDLPGANTDARCRMASITREIVVKVSPGRAWSAVKDVGAVHERLVPGLVTQVKLEAGSRHVVFANGLAIDELIVTIDDSSRRLVYAAQNRARHHQASMQVVADGEQQCRFVWITDVLPDEAVDRFASMMDQALPIIKDTLETYPKND